MPVKTIVSYIIGGIVGGMLGAAYGWYRNDAGFRDATNAYIDTWAPKENNTHEHTPTSQCGR